MIQDRSKKEAYPVFNSLPSNAGGTGSTLDLGTKIPHAMWCSQKKKKKVVKKGSNNWYTEMKDYIKSHLQSNRTNTLTYEKVLKKEMKLTKA